MENELLPVIPGLRCEQVSRFTVRGEAVEVQCLGQPRHGGNCTMIDPVSLKPINVHKTATTW
jgi:hypothetical protein